MQGTLTIDSGVFTPAATAGPSNDGKVRIQLPRRPGDNDGPVNDCSGLKVVANLTATAARRHAARGLPITVELGYADNLRPNGYFPNPWNGSPNTIFDGDLDRPGAYDGGAILITNTTSSPITVNDVSVIFRRRHVRSLGEQRGPGRREPHPDADQWRELRYQR